VAAYASSERATSREVESESGASTASAMLSRAIGFLVKEEMVKQTVGFVSGVQGRQHAAAGMPAEGTLEGGGYRGTVAGEAVTDAVESVAESGVAAFGNLTEASCITALNQDGVKTSKRPNMICCREPFDLADPGQVARRMIGAHAWNGDQDLGG
jgi:hypothetical protein